MALKIRRGTESQRQTVTFAAGEIVWTTNGHKLYVGDGITTGGIDVASQLGGTGILYNQTSGKLDIDLTNTNTDTLTEGNNNLYYTLERGKFAAGQALVDGNDFNSGIVFTYDDVHNRITAEVSPELGLPTQTGQGGKFLQTNGASTLWASVNASVSSDPSPTLGGNLSLNGHNITGTGNVSITGTVSSANAQFDTITLKDALSTLTFNVGANGLFVKGLQSSGNAQGAVITAYQSRGTLGTPLAVDAGDFLSGVATLAHNGSDYVFAGNFGIVQDPAFTFNSSSTSIPTGFVITVPDNSNNPVTYTFNSQGILNTPTLWAGNGNATHPSIAFSTDGSVDTGFFHPGDGILCISTDGTERVRVDNGGMRVAGFMKVANVNGTLPNPPEAGMIVLDGTTFKGYNGSAWVALN